MQSLNQSMDQIIILAITQLVYVIFCLTMLALCIHFMPEALKLKIQKSVLFRNFSTKTNLCLLVLASVLTVATGVIPFSIFAEHQAWGVPFNVMTVDPPTNGSGLSAHLKGTGTILNFITCYFVLSLAHLKWFRGERNAPLSRAQPDDKT